MMPQLGVLSTVHQQAATEVFNKDCLIHLGTCIAPAGESREGKEMLSYKFEFPDGRKEEGKLMYGEMKLLKLGFDEKSNLPLKANAKLEPAGKLDLGEGPGKDVERSVSGGVVGIILDGRGRPFQVPTDDTKRVNKLIEWMTELNIYPKEALERD
jgi:hypothetical protein